MDEPPIATSADAETAHKIGRKSARSPRIEVIARNDRRRTWTLDQKREIVAKSLGPGLTPTEVARKHAISSGQLYTWRQQVLGGQMTLLSHAPPDFAQVEMTAAPHLPDAPAEYPLRRLPATHARRGVVRSSTQHRHDTAQGDQADVVADAHA
jgi:transposase-like protein